MHEHLAAWGQHLVLDFAGCPHRLLSGPEHLKAWVAELVATIKMRPYGEPSIEHFATHTPDPAGYTVVQLIETSNICAHFAENRGEAYIDIFSCTAFSNNDAEALCRQYFEPEWVTSTVLRRGAAKTSLAEAG